MFIKVYTLVLLFLICPVNLYNDYSKEIIGTISIPKYNYKKNIVEGMNETSLSSDLIGSYGQLDFNSHIILAGHNKSKVFRIITRLQKNDVIIIDNLLTKKYYKVNDIQVVDRNKRLKVSSNKLTLVTCVDNSRNRLIINANKVS